MQTTQWCRAFEDIGLDDLEDVGGKTASLGEMINQLGAKGIEVPTGFAVVAQSYRAIMAHNDLDAFVAETHTKLEADETSLAEAGAQLRRAVYEAAWPEGLREAVEEAYAALSAHAGDTQAAVAVRSSATAEDLPTASFAGQQESFLNVRGVEQLVEACRRCFASLFTDRAITYRRAQGFDPSEVALSIAVQQMVQSVSSGVMFTIDTETGFPDLIMISAAWGYGEYVVKGEVTPDQYTVYTPLLDRAELHPILSRRVGTKTYKLMAGPSMEEPTQRAETTAQERSARVLSDEDVVALARIGARIAEHYGRPMDIEWARDPRRTPHHRAGAPGDGAGASAGQRHSYVDAHRAQ